MPKTTPPDFEAQPAEVVLAAEVDVAGALAATELANYAEAMKDHRPIAEVSE